MIQTWGSNAVWALEGNITFSIVLGNIFHYLRRYYIFHVVCISARRATVFEAREPLGIAREVASRRSTRYIWLRVFIWPRVVLQEPEGYIFYSSLATHLNISSFIHDLKYSIENRYCSLIFFALICFDILCNAWVELTPDIPQDGCTHGWKACCWLQLLLNI